MFRWTMSSIFFKHSLCQFAASLISYIHLYIICSLGTFLFLAPRCGFQRSLKGLSGEPATCFCAPVFTTAGDVELLGGFKHVVHRNLESWSHVKIYIYIYIYCGSLTYMESLSVSLEKIITITSVNCTWAIFMQFSIAMQHVTRGYKTSKIIVVNSLCPDGESFQRAPQLAQRWGPHA